MPQSCESFLRSLNLFSKQQIDNAGQRYTPQIDACAPNIRIEPLITAIDNVACGARARERFQSVLDDFSDAWKNAKYCSQRPKLIEKKVNKAYEFLSPMMDRLRSGEASVGEEWLNLIAKIESDLMKDMKHWHSESAQPLKDIDRGNIDHKMSVINRCLTIVRNEKEYGLGSAFKSLHDPNLLIRGEWGTGKTHLLCDVTRERISRKQVTIIVLAKNFRGNIVTEICSCIEKKHTVEEILDRIEKLAYETKERAIFILDGVNEGSRQEWLEAITAFQSLIADRPNIGLVVSCRTPFESISIEKKTLEKFHKMTHRGFDDQEFDAQAEFFRYYNIPLSEVPLLDREFSRPLVLKLICQSLQDLTEKKLKKEFAGIASGQKGMTYVLESFIKSVGKKIECKYDLISKGCWKLLKGCDKINDRESAGFAPCMAEKSRNYVDCAEADRIISANYPKLEKSQRLDLLDELRINGIIDEDTVFYSTKSESKHRIVFRLPYERFSDHLIARCLLSKKYLCVSSEETIRKSFSGESPLARVFRISNLDSREYERPGWAQALITEFPIHAKNLLRSKKLSPDQCELFFMLPKQSQDLGTYIGPFIEGIFWRNPASFTNGTQAIIDRCLKSRSREWRQMVDALVAVSTKPNHPYCAQRLYDFLASYSMPDRDLQWSEYLRNRHFSPSIRRLLFWAENLDEIKMTQDFAERIIVLLSLVLTTVIRRDRDLATKTLVLIGEKFPEVLFNHVETSLEFNDPYVPERMLAAAYGTTLSLVDSDVASTFRPLLGNLAKILYQKMFLFGAENATHHALMGDYALGIIEIAQRANCVSLPKSSKHDLTFPFSNVLSTFTSDGTPDSSVKKSIGYVIQMDFGNKVIGSLIPDWVDYECERLDYIRIRSKIERRIFDLGYRAEHFGDIDREIGSNNPHRIHDKDKVERYGKKYSWIAYFEMWGELDSEKKLPDWCPGKRTSDCGIDPSFPERPPTWTPPILDFFGDTSDTTENWIKGGCTPDWRSLLMVPKINEHYGDWVLLDGCVFRTNKSLDRDILTYLRGLFVARKDINNFREKFILLDHPGNGNIPEGANEYYVYAGEFGRRHNYLRDLYRKNVGYCQQMRKAFDRDTLEHLEGKISIDNSIAIEIPYIEFRGEPYHSYYNDFLIFHLPAPRLIQHLGLASRNREVDFYDSTGKPGTLYRETVGEPSEDKHRLLYIRTDLLRRYLIDTRQVLVWCIWGIRDWFKKMEDNKVIRTPVREEIYNSYSHIYRSFYQWSEKDFKSREK